MAIALISLGSNMGESESIIRGSLKALSELDDCRLIKKSSLYRSAPWGYKDQDDFLNAACMLETSLPPLDLLIKMQRIELEFHRERHFKYGPRTLDLDLIAFDEKVLNTKELTLPHKHMHERAFVLVPLNEIAPDFKVAPSLKKISELKDALSSHDLQEVIRLG